MNKRKKAHYINSYCSECGNPGGYHLRDCPHYQDMELHPAGTLARLAALEAERAALRAFAGERCAPDENIIEWAIARIEWLEAKCDGAVIALANLEKTRADLPPANPDAARICLLRNMGLEA